MTTDDSPAQPLAAQSLAAQPVEAQPLEEMRELEVRVAQLEAVVLAHAERLAEFDAAARVRQRRALWIRLIILVLALLAFFALRTFGGGSGS